MGLPHAWRVALDQKVNRTEWLGGSPPTLLKADKAQTWYVMPWSSHPQPRPAHPGPVVMVVPATAVPLIEYNGTTDGGAGLVPGLDWVAVEEEEDAPAPGVTAVTPSSIATAVRLGAPNITTSSTAIQTIFGCNAGNPTGGSESVADRIAWFGRLPMQRWYYGVNGLPAAFSTSKAGGSPEKKVQVSFKWSPAEVLAGTWDARFDSYFSSSPADWYIEATYWHEPNAELNSGQFTITQFKNATIRLSNRLESLGITNRVKIAPNFTAPRTGGGVAWSDSWMMTPDQLHDGAIWTWDTYGNPPPPLTQLPYPNMVTSCADPIHDLNSTYGWEKWGITEFNAPRRTGDANELIRVGILDDFVNACLNDGDTPPYHMLLWEGDGVQFDQNFYTDATKDWYAGWVAQSPAA
jgi:hypothetical protein